MSRPNRWLSAGAAIAAALTLVVVLTGCPKPPPKTEPPPAVPEQVEKGQTILIVASAAPNPTPKHCKLSKGMRKDEDHVRWLNQTGAQVTIKFTTGIWPFLETQRDIVVENGKFSEYFTLDPSKSASDCPYKTDPPATDTGGAPGDPSITVDP
jgi:hypothetical protein